MTITVTQEVYEIRSISPVHINPSIMEGRGQYPSILGEDRAITIVRYAPFFVTNPLLTGDAGIPSTLTCSAGVVDASPAPIRTYTWYADGVEVMGIGGSGLNANKFTSNNSYDAKEITCVVTATNILGSAEGTSNGIVVSVIEPIYLMEADFYFTTGLAAESSITVFEHQVAVITGMAMTDSVTVLHTDTYIVEAPVYVESFSIGNSGAESGSLTGWTVESGSPIALATTSHTGSYVFAASLSQHVNNSTISKTFDINPDHYDLVDDRNAFASVNFFATSNTTDSAQTDDLTVYIECFSEDLTLLGTIDHWGVITPFKKGSSNYWGSYPGLPELIPPLTRMLKLKVIFLPSYNGCNCQVDDISLHLWSTE